MGCLPRSRHPSVHESYNVSTTEWSKRYALSDIKLSVGDNMINVEATCKGPHGAMVWLRAWLSNEVGTLSETAIGPVEAGSKVLIGIPIPDKIEAQDRHTVYIRIESAPLQTEHVVSIPIDNESLCSPAN